MKSNDFFFFFLLLHCKSCEIIQDHKLFRLCRNCDAEYFHRLLECYVKIEIKGLITPLRIHQDSINMHQKYI